MQDPKFFELLICPQSQGALEINVEGTELISRAAGLAYPIIDGIPVLIVEQARPLTPDEVLNQDG